MVNAAVVVAPGAAAGTDCWKSIDQHRCVSIRISAHFQEKVTRSAERHSKTKHDIGRFDVEDLQELWSD